MKTRFADNIRNVAILGNSGCGKTTLVEAMAFASGLINKLGSISEGDTISDFDKEEIKRKASLSTSVIPMEWDTCKINVLDTPGNVDLIGEVEEALEAADCAVIVVNGKNGVEPGTIKAWQLCERFRLPRLFFVTAMDDDNASYRKVVEDLTQRYGKRIAPFHQPIRENGKFVGYVNITKMKARKFTGIAKYEEIDIPDYAHENLAGFRDTLLESVASTSDELMEKYFDEVEFEQEEIDNALSSSCFDGTLVPVTMGSGLNVHGVFMLLNDIVRYLTPPIKGKTGVTVNNELFDAIYDEHAAIVAQVFKTITDPFIGRYSLVKVYSGVLKPDSILYNMQRDCDEKISRIYTIVGKEVIEAESILPGDIGAIPKLNYTRTGEALSTKQRPVKLDFPKFSTPYTYMAYDIMDKKDEAKVNSVLEKICDEDVTVILRKDEQTKKMLIGGMSEQHLEIVADKLKSKYKIEIKLSSAPIAYKETITTSCRVEGKYKKQSGGHGQYGHVIIDVEPLYDKSIKYEFCEKVVGGAVPKNFFPAVDKGIEEGLEKGVISEYPVTGVKVTLVDGSFHSVDSSEMAFKMATQMAIKEALNKAKSILLEPIVTMRVLVPKPCIGNVLGDLNKRRARIMGMDQDKQENQIISLEIPLSEIKSYATILKSMTGGLGTYAYEFMRYEPIP